MTLTESVKHMNLDPRVVSATVGLVALLGALIIFWADTKAELVRASTTIKFNQQRISTMENVIKDLPVAFERLANMDKTLNRLDRRMARQEQFKLTQDPTR